MTRKRFQHTIPRKYMVCLPLCPCERISRHVKNSCANVQLKIESLCHRASIHRARPQVMFPERRVPTISQGADGPQVSVTIFGTPKLEPRAHADPLSTSVRLYRTSSNCMKNKSCCFWVWLQRNLASVDHVESSQKLHCCPFPCLSCQPLVSAFWLEVLLNCCTPLSPSLSKKSPVWAEARRGLQSSLCIPWSAFDGGLDSLVLQNNFLSASSSCFMVVLAKPGDGSSNLLCINFSFHASINLKSIRFAWSKARARLTKQ